MSDKIRKTEEEWRASLTPEQYHITREHGTEPAFTGRYHDHKGKGTYRCVACGEPLFVSEHKFDSGTGWPSYFQPLSRDAIASVLPRRTLLSELEEILARGRAIAAAVERAADDLLAARPRAVINATGVVVHTHVSRISQKLGLRKAARMMIRGMRGIIKTISVTPMSTSSTNP